MMKDLDPAVRQALGLRQTAVTSVNAHGGSGFTSTSKISVPGEIGSEPQQFFLKTAPGTSAAVMFAGEHASLNALHDAVPSLCPASYGTGELKKTPGTHFLVTEFLDVGSAVRSAGVGGSEMSLAEKLAKLHTATAPVPQGYDKPMFGFPMQTCCGDTPQPNDYHSTWASFYANCRLKSICNRIEANHGKDKDLRDVVERVAEEIVPRLLRDGHLGGSERIKPVVVHGDLWAGNKGRGKIGGRSGVEDVVFDPSSCYAHSEYELGIMRMFGGFGGSFLSEYHKLVPKTEPQGEYEDRVSLYELYHHLNHTAMFGGSYRSGAMGIMRGLLRKYGHRS